ncbi:MAG: hypothetical protein DKT66_18195 [Candidatus Melainabacteria bacterium]|nr:MAG: hypothetical protein DKT66_18195 [Candidatus Melainabacteria bacterium]
MTRRKIFLKRLLPVLAGIIFLLLCLYLYASNSSDEILRASSPDNRFDAVVTQTNYGVGSDFVFWVYLVPKGQKIISLEKLFGWFPSHHQCSIGVFRGATKDDSSWGVEVHWKDARTILIKYSQCKSQSVPAGNIDFEGQIFAVTVDGRVLDK